MEDPPLTRRRLLGLGGAALATGLVGCQTDDGGDGVPEVDTTAVDGSGTPSADGTPTPTDSPRTDGTEQSTTADGETTDGTATGADSGSVPPLDDLSLRAERVASGFASPVAIEIPAPGRRFVVDQPGQIYLIDGGDLRSEPFLDVSDRMVDVSGYDERGLLGLAFHPDFAENGRFYVRYSAPPRDGTPADYSHTFVLSEFTADPGADRADPDSERTVLEIPEPQGNHNAGAVTFGPDGSLYVAVGDGGRANDQGVGHVDDWYDGVGGGNGQDLTENLLGSILRIDVDEQTEQEGPGTRRYGIPEDNPLVGETGLDEQFAWGFRNPWRFSFGPDGRLFAADVGQGAWEEVNVVESGGNYGWNVREGTHCFRADDCPSESPRGRPLRDPVIEYPHDGDPVSGIAVIGGYLYRGSDLPDLRGRYLFADWRAGGQLFVAEEADDGLWPTAAVPVSSEERFGPNVLSFGRTPAGELLVCTTASGGVDGNSGAVFRLRSAE
jgi:glucose/arabinose dehydrogenase